MFVKSNRGWLSLAHIPFGDEHLSESLHLKDTRDNQRVAEKLKREIEAEIRSGTFDYTRRFPNSRHLARLGLKSSAESTLAEFAVEWLGEKVSLTDATRYDYHSQLKFHLLSHRLAAMRLSEIDDGHVNHFIAHLRAKKTRSEESLSERRINMVIARLRSIFATAYRRKLIANDPMRHVENLREKRHDADPFDLDEARRIVEAAAGWERAFATTLLYTGMRPGEALALRWPVIDWDHGLILVRQTVSRRYGFGLPKTRGSERDVEMIAPVRNALRDQRARSQLKGDLVFPSGVFPVSTSWTVRGD